MVPVATLFGFLTAMSWGFGDFLSRKPAEQIGSYLTSAYIQPIGLVLLLGYSFTLGPVNIEVLTSNIMILIVNIAAGMISFVGLALLFRGYEQGVMSIAAPIAGSYPAVTVALSVLILGTVLSETKALAIVAVIAGILISGVKFSEFRGAKETPEKGGTISRQRLIKGVNFALVTCLCSGFTLFVLGIVTPVFGSIFPIVVIKATETVVAFLLLMPMKKPRLRIPNMRALFWLAIMGFCDTAGFVTYSYGIGTAGVNIPLVVTLSGFTGIVTMLLARAFYNERIEKAQVFGILIMTIGVATILYF